MKRNRDLPLPEPWQSYNHQPLPGFLYCRMLYAMGSGLGSWEVLVVIDLEKREYNDYVHLWGGYRDYYHTEIVVDSIEDNGILISRRELRTILRLSKSEVFRKFTEDVPVSRICDTNYSALEIYNTSDRVYLCMQGLHLYRGIAFPKDKYQWSARHWTRGLRRIERKV